MIIEKLLREKYRMVLIRSPHEIMHDQFTSELFPKVIGLKTAGYQKEYGEFVLPFDSSDFVASHLLLTEIMPDGSLSPVLGFKSVTLKRCDDYKIPFPVLGMVEGTTPNPEYRESFLNIMNKYRDEGRSDQLAYNGSFTILPRVRENKILMKSLWDITFSLLTNYYIEYNIHHVVAVCSTTFNVHKKKEALGWNFIDGSEGMLKAYNCKVLCGSSFIPMELVDIKAKSQEPSGKFKDMWDARVTLDRESVERVSTERIKKAA